MKIKHYVCSGCGKHEIMTANPNVIKNRKCRVCGSKFKVKKEEKK